MSRSGYYGLQTASAFMSGMAESYNRHLAMQADLMKYEGAMKRQRVQDDFARERFEWQKDYQQQMIGVREVKAEAAGELTPSQQTSTYNSLQKDLRGKLVFNTETRDYETIQLNDAEIENMQPVAEAVGYRIETVETAPPVYDYRNILGIKRDVPLETEPAGFKYKLVPLSGQTVPAEEELPVEPEKSSGGVISSIGNLMVGTSPVFAAIKYLKLKSDLRAAQNQKKIPTISGQRKISGIGESFPQYQEPPVSDLPEEISSYVGATSEDEQAEVLDFWSGLNDEEKEYVRQALKKGYTAQQIIEKIKTANVQ